jgi:AcrR family transcriptional regulator
VARHLAQRKLPYKPRLSPSARKDAIEQAAVRLFAERGYDGVSTDDIVAAAGISRPTLYAHFPSKRDLYRELVRKHSKQMVDYMSHLIRTSELPPAEQIAAATESFFAYVEQHRFAWRMLFREPPSDPMLSRRARRIHDQARANVAALLRRLVPPDEQIDERALLLHAEALKAAQQAFAAWWYDHPDTPRDLLVATIVAMASAVVGGGPRPT